MELTLRIMDAGDLEGLISVLKDDLPLHIPFEMGSIRWKEPEEGPVGEWDIDVEDDFPECRDFVSEHYPLSGARELDIEEDIECRVTDPWAGGMNGQCRARTRTGDPVLIRLRSALVVPLYYNKDRVGVMSLYSSREEAFRDLSDDESTKVLWRAVGNSLGRSLDSDGLRRDRDRSRTLLDSSEDILVLWRRNGSLWEIDCNKKADIFINRPELLPDMMEGPFFAPPGKEWDRGMFAWSKAFDEGEDYQVNLELVDIDGHIRPHLCTFSPYMEEGNTVGVKMTAIETARIDEAVERLEKMNNCYRTLISTLSHDLNNPISAILGYSDLLRFAKGEKKRAYIEKISGLSARMSRTIDMVKVLSRIQEGELRKDFRLLDISSMIRRSLENLSPDILSYDISCDLREENSQIIGHEMLEQVLMNILDNAMKYSPKNSRISIDLSADIVGMTISIKDQGDGVPDRYKESIFRRFDGSDMGEGIQGTGFGLAIAKGIVELHRGRIWVEDNEPSGSVFKIKLPWSQD
ncbi:MAG: GAF domain-containing sensor histidine kinase [Thermoplasmatota archaeon]